MTCPYFYKLVLSSTIQSRRLRIPDNFVRKIRDGLSAVVTLTIPDGRVWHVGLQKADNKFWLQDGWQQFVDYYAIRVGYFLVFRYKGNSAFNVYIYNLSSSEINYRSNGVSRPQGNNYGNNGNVFEEMEDEDYAEVFGSSSPQCLTYDALKSKLCGDSADQRTAGNMYSPPALQNLFSGSKYKNYANRPNEADLQTPQAADNSPSDLQSSRDTSIQFSVTGIKKSADEVKLPNLDSDTQGTKKRGRKRKTASNELVPFAQNKGEGELRDGFYKSASARKRTVTAEERERALNAAKAFQPVNPFCRVVLRPSYLYRGCIMYLPSCFAEKNLNGVSGSIMLQTSDGRQWPVRCLYRGGKAKFSRGWYEFCLENNLGEGDVCVFELIKAREIVLKVTMFRVVENALLPSPTPVQSFSQSRVVRN